MNNSRTEPYPLPTTPSRATSYGLPTPQTEHHGFPNAEDLETPYTPSKPPRPGIDTNAQNTVTTSDAGDDEFFDWPLSGDEEVNRTVDQASQGTILPETPRKSVKSNALVSRFLGHHLYFCIIPRHLDLPGTWTDASRLHPANEDSTT